MTLPLLKDAGNLRGKRVFLAVDLNVPIQNGRVIDDFRIKQNQRTIDFLKQNGARTLLVSHRTEEAASLLPVFEYLKKIYTVVFVSTIADTRKALERAQNGTFVMLENIRKVGGNKEKTNDPAFAKELASLADVYVNEIFPTSHRPHASIIGVPKLLPSYAGFVFAEEVEHLSKAFSPEHPMLVILGGAKFETKTPLIEKFLTIADDIYVCGALANDIYKARGYETGVSLVSGCTIENDILDNPKVHVPSDVIVRTTSRSMAKSNLGDSVARFAGGEFREKGSTTVEKEEKIVDAGSDAIADLRALVEKAKFVLWNGPLGEYEAGFDAGTIALAQELAECDAETIIGGGDTLAAVSKLGLLERFSFISTGGGAMLEFLANETLPGIKALKSSVIPAKAGIP